MTSFANHPHSYHTMPALRSSRRSVTPSPPGDTDHDSTLVPPGSFPRVPGEEFDVTGHYVGATPERRYQPRKTFAMPYQNSGARDLRERGHTRGSRNLVVVVPPVDFPLDQGQLGNVLSTGPRHRLSQGILMPLFPSLFGQLNAIAREYNFPSTVGLCLYLHINENGIAMTPRISEDSWQYLFGHLFGDHTPSGGQQLPIGGSIEFDIDFNKAIWFDAWLSGALRDSEPTSPPSLGAHWRGHSKTTNADGQHVHDRWDVSGSATLISNSRPETALRHLPRKLSLVDRLDMRSVHLSPQSQKHLDSPSPTHDLSPIPQSAVPRSPNSDLGNRVKSWRASTELFPASMTEAYKEIPDAGAAVHVTTMDEYALERNFRQGVKVEEYLSSLTPQSPLTLAMESPIPSPQLSSVYDGRRAHETILLAPATVTNSGPTNDAKRSVVSSVSRLPSPSMRKRVFEDIAALEPRAIWGNSFGWHIATTWKEVYPYSVVKSRPTIRIQLQDLNGPVPQYPNLVIYPSVYPSKPSHQSVWGSSFGWQGEVTWRKVYPYSTVMVPSVAPTQLPGTGGLVSKYPGIYIYPAVYPSYEIYPACSIAEDASAPVPVVLKESGTLISCYYPSLVIYPDVYPHFNIYPPIAEGIETKGMSRSDTTIYGASNSYPNLVIYPTIYPHFDLYPATLQVTVTPKRKEVVVRLQNVGHPAVKYPSMSIYPSAYPHLDVYPIQHSRKAVASAIWGVSFGWLSVKTWNQVYPLHIVKSSTTNRRINDQKSVIANTAAIWGSSFGWKNATTWRAAWPTSYTKVHSTAQVSVHLGHQRNSSLNYPYLVIYPLTYPHFDIYPAVAAVTETEESQTLKSQYIVGLTPHYPSLVIYPAVYPHLDVYLSFVRALVTAEPVKGQSNLQGRQIEARRAKTAAQVGLAELLANNHNWEVDEPLRLDLADYAWSQTSAGPPTPPMDLSDILNIERLPTPDLGQRSVDDTESTESSYRVKALQSGFVREYPHLVIYPLAYPHFDLYPSCEHVLATKSSYRVKALQSGFVREYPHLVIYPLAYPHFDLYPSGENILATKSSYRVKALQSGFVREYPHLVIYPLAYPHFDLYPSGENIFALENHVTETPVHSNIYPVINIYPAVYPHFDIYPNFVLRIESLGRVDSNVQYERVETRLPSLYPNLDIYRACYPYNLDHVYSSICAKESLLVASRGYPWLVVYSPVYPFVIPYPELSAEIIQPSQPDQSYSTFLVERKFINVKLPTQYPLLDPYPAGYPLSLQSVYPCSEVAKPQYPYFSIYPAMQPSVQPLSDSVPRSLDEGEYEYTKMKTKDVNSGSAVYPYIELYPATRFLTSGKNGAIQDAYVGNLATPLPLRNNTTPRNRRKTHKELHDLVFQSLDMRPARNSKTHLQLHTEVFRDGIVWTPSGYAQDIASLTPKTREHTQQESPGHPIQSNPTPHPSRSPSGPSQSPHNTVFSLRQPRASTQLPLQIRSPGIPPLAVSETPIPRVSSPPTHRTTGSRFTQAIRSIVHRRTVSTTGASPAPEEHKEHPKENQPHRPRFRSLVDHSRPTVLPQLQSDANTPEPMRRVPRLSQTEGFVHRRVRVYEQATAGNEGARAQSSFTLPPLPPMAPITDVTETIDQSRYTYA